MVGETIQIWYKTPKGKDPFGGSVFSKTNDLINNVLVQPLAPEDDISNTRPDGIKSRLKLLIPKSYAETANLEELRSATVKVRDYEYKVVGRSAIFKNCPTKWCMEVFVEEIDG